MPRCHVLRIIIVLSIVCFVNANNKTVNSSTHHEETVQVHNATTLAPDDVESTTESNFDKIISGIKGLFKDFKRRFLDKYHKLEDFFSSSKRDLEHKIEDTERYIAIVEEQQRQIIVKLQNDTKQQAQKVHNTLNSWLNDVAEFKTKVVNSAKADYDDLQEEWRRKITDKWNNGLETVIEISRKAEIDKNDQQKLIKALNGTSTD